MTRSTVPKENKNQKQHRIIRHRKMLAAILLHWQQRIYCCTKHKKTIKTSAKLTAGVCNITGQAVGVPTRQYSGEIKQGGDNTWPLVVKTLTTRLRLVLRRDQTGFVVFPEKLLFIDANTNKRHVLQCMITNHCDILHSFHLIVTCLWL